MPEKQLSPESVKMAVNITIAGMPMQAGSLISSPDAVSKFIEVIATKIEQLQHGTQSRP